MLLNPVTDKFPEPVAGNEIVLVVVVTGKIPFGNFHLYESAFVIELAV